MAKQINDPFERAIQRLQQEIKDVRYCKICGKPVLFSSTTENNTQNPFWEWEWQNSVHVQCVNNSRNKR